MLSKIKNWFYEEVSYDVWVYKNKDSYYTKIYWQFGKLKQRELTTDEIKRMWNVKYFCTHYDCE